MTNFEKITETPEALGEFLASLPVADGPWDVEFRKAFCAKCERENCDGKRCPHKAERNNPLWWLKLGEKQGEVPGLSIRVKAAFPILWDREYYTVARKQKETRAPCVCCDNTGKYSRSHRIGNAALTLMDRPGASPGLPPIASHHSGRSPLCGQVSVLHSNSSQESQNVR